MLKYLTLLLPLCTLSSLNSYAQTDSLIIKGQMQNLNGRLYRQAPSVTFSRNNILLPQSELSKQAPLQPDGSFRISLPIIYSKEEIYVDYGGKAFTTFLGSKGEVNIRFDGDSLGKANRIFYFSGVNADANNAYFQYKEEEKKQFEAEKNLGVNFYKTYWDKSLKDAASSASLRAIWRKQTLDRQTFAASKDPVFVQWMNSIAEDEERQNLLEAVLSKNMQTQTTPVNDLPNMIAWPLTVQKVTLGDRFGEYADAIIREQNYQQPGKRNTLPVKTMANLFLDHIKPLSPSEREKLMELSEKGTSARSDIDFLSSLFSRNEAEINTLFDFEREKKMYHELFQNSAAEFLDARFLPRNFYKYTYKNQLMLGKHIQKGLTNTQFQKSLAELVDMEVKDSLNISKFVNFRSVKDIPEEVVPGYWAAQSNSRGGTWLTQVFNTMSGKTIYLVLWSIDDKKSRENMDHMAAIRAQLPDDVEFIYLHGKEESEINGEDLVKQFAIRHHMEGTHLFLTLDQMIDILSFKMRTSESEAYAIIKPNGKFLTRDAPPPSEPEKLIPLLLNAGK